MRNSLKQQIRSQTAVRKRNVFRFFLKRSSEMSGERKLTGRLLHTAGMLTENEWYDTDPEFSGSSVGTLTKKKKRGHGFDSHSLHSWVVPSASHSHKFICHFNSRPEGSCSAISKAANLALEQTNFPCENKDINVNDISFYLSCIKCAVL